MGDKIQKYAPWAGMVFLLMVAIVGWRSAGWPTGAGATVFAVLAFFIFRYILNRKQKDKKGQGGWSGPQDAPRPQKPSHPTPSTKKAKKTSEKAKRGPKKE